MSAFQELTVLELKDRLDAGEELFLLDVREPEETQISRLPGTVLVPLATLGEHLHEIPRDQAVIVICRAGGRSAQAAGMLADNGFDRIWNLSGGMKSWSAQIDPSMPVA